VLLHISVDSSHKLVLGDDTVPSGEGAEELASVVVRDVATASMLNSLLDLVLGDATILSVSLVLSTQEFVT